MKMNAETLSAYYQMKEANLKRVHTVWFQLLDRLESKLVQTCTE